MAFQISPGVNTSEIDLTAIVPAVQTTAGGFAGQFRWGPVEQRVLISNESQLVGQFQKPNGTYFKDFFTAANFLAYSDTLHTVRINNTGLNNANALANNSVLIKGEDDYDNNYSTGIAAAGDFAAKYAGALGNSLKSSICPSNTAFESTLSGTYTAVNGNNGVVFSANQAAVISAGDLLQLGPDKDIFKVSSVAASGLSVVLTKAYTGNTVNAGTALNRRWEFYDLVTYAPGTSPWATTRGGTNDQMHVVVVDEDGEWTNVKGQVIEVFDNVSKASDAKNEDGSTNYYVERINRTSQYLWWTGHTSGLTNAGSAASAAFGGGVKPATASLAGGSDGSAGTAGQYQTAYDLFKSSEAVDISLLLAGSSTSATAVHLINNIAEFRKDCVVCISPEQADVVNNTSYVSAQTDDIIEFRNTLPSTSYAVLDSGYKYQYDKYNDQYRYVPLNGDTAGTMARTDQVRDPWYSPAGLTRGRIKNVVNLAFNPNKTERDQLYKNGVNPVTTFPGEGTILFGDKTLLAHPSAFDRINVRRLFIVLEKAIAIAARQSLFEFNDEFTRAQFVNLVEPFLRDVQGRRGITDFRVVCDDTNNSSEIIDRNEFVGDIFVKPARSINFIQLNFVAVRTGVEFEEVVGSFG